MRPDRCRVYTAPVRRLPHTPYILVYFNDATLGRIGKQMKLLLLTQIIVVFILYLLLLLTLTVVLSLYFLYLLAVEELSTSPTPLIDSR